MALSQLGRVHYCTVGEGLCSAPVGYRVGKYFADASREGLRENKINMLAFKFHVETSSEHVFSNTTTANVIKCAFKEGT